MNPSFSAADAHLFCRVLSAGATFLYTAGVDPDEVQSIFHGLLAAGDDLLIVGLSLKLSFDIYKTALARAVCIYEVHILERDLIPAPRVRQDSIGRHTGLEEFVELKGVLVE